MPVLWAGEGDEASASPGRDQALCQLAYVSSKCRQEDRSCGALVKSMASGATDPGFKSQFCYFWCDLEHI